MRRYRGPLGVLLLLLLIVAAQYGLQRYASAVLNRTLARARGWADIEVGRRRFWLWGVADLDNISIAPSAWLGAMYGLPVGYSIAIDHLRLYRLRFGWDDGPALMSAELDATGVHVPLPHWQWRIVIARNAENEPLAPPTLQSLGLSTLSFGARLRGDFSHGYVRPRLRLTAADDGLARVQLRCALRLPADAISDPSGITIRSCRLDYEDLGLIQRFEARMARDNRMMVPEIKAAISAQVGHDAARSHWPLLNTQAVQGFIFQPEQTLRLSIDPAEPLPLNRIPRGIWPGLPAYLGLTAELPSPPPGMDR